MRIDVHVLNNQIRWGSMNTFGKKRLISLVELLMLIFLILALVFVVFKVTKCTYTRTGGPDAAEQTTEIKVKRAADTE